MKIILGLRSRGRQKVLKRAGIPFATMAADIDEKAIRSDDYEELPLVLARAKAEALLPRIHEPALLITSDQVVVWNGQLREKPETEAEARHFLQTSSEAPVQANTSVVVVNTATGKRVEGLDIVVAHLKPIPKDAIDKLITSGEPYNWAGGIAVEHPLIEPCVTKIEGEVDSITGLPLTLAKQLLEEAQQ